MTSARVFTLRDLAKEFPLPMPGGHGDKEQRGSALSVAGGAQAPGAALLTGVAALRAGAGKLQIAAPREGMLSLGLAVPEAGVVGVGKTSGGDFDPHDAGELLKWAADADAVVVGPGLMDKVASSDLAKSLMSAAKRASFVIDAAAMVGLGLECAAARDLTGRLVLTPHAGEMAALTGRTKETVIGAPLDAARQVSDALGCVVVMKGATTFVAEPSGQAWRHDGGAIGLGTSGSGDVLAGLIAGLLARGVAAGPAACWGVAVHARAGERLTDEVGSLGFLARQLLDVIPSILSDASGQGTSDSRGD